MNRRFLILMVAVAAIYGCKSSVEKSENKTVKAEQVEVKAISVSQLLNTAKEYVDKETVITGRVKHVCQHSGRRCFLVGKDGTSLKIEASGKLTGFNNEILGMTIKVKGVVKEQRISKEKIEKIAAAQKANEEDGHCGTESENILRMRKWMKTNGKDYFAFYYINGIEYEIVR